MGRHSAFREAQIAIIRNPDSTAQERDRAAKMLAIGPDGAQPASIRRRALRAKQRAEASRAAEPQETQPAHDGDELFYLCMRGHVRFSGGEWVGGDPATCEDCRLAREQREQWAAAQVVPRG